MSLEELSYELKEINKQRALIVRAIEDELNMYGDDEMVDVMNEYGIEL